MGKGPSKNAALLRSEVAIASPLSRCRRIVSGFGRCGGDERKCFGPVGWVFGWERRRWPCSFSCRSSSSSTFTGLRPDTKTMPPPTAICVRRNPPSRIIPAKSPAMSIRPVPSAWCFMREGISWRRPSWRHNRCPRADTPTARILRLPSAYPTLSPPICRGRRPAWPSPSLFPGNSPRCRWRPEPSSAVRPGGCMAWRKI